MNNKIYVIGAIDEAQYIKFSKRLSAIRSVYTGTAPLLVELFSAGGEARTAIAIADRMRTSGFSFNVTAYGQVDSAAVMILAQGDTRLIAANTTILLHEDSITIDADDSKKTSSLEVYTKHIRDEENLWAKMLADRTKASFETWLQLHKDETYLDAQQALNLGLVDKII